MSTFRTRGAARTFAYKEPYYRAGVFGSVLLAFDGEARLGRAAVVQAPDREAAVTLLPASGDGRTDHSWRFGGRPAQR